MRAPIIRTYDQALAYLGSKFERPLEYKTRLRRRADNSIVVRHHSTDIVTYHQDGTIVLRNGGWFTPTTKDRLQRYGDVHILQYRSIWYVNPTAWPLPEGTLFFHEGVTKLPDGEFVGLYGENLPTLHRKRRIKP